MAVLLTDPAGMEAGKLWALAGLGVQVKLQGGPSLWLTPRVLLFCLSPLFQAHGSKS